MKTMAVVLAAGQGTRMRSALPKVVHPLAGRPMIRYALEAAHRATSQDPVAVIGYGADAVRLAAGEGVRFVIQQEQLGTGHALMQVEPVLRGQSDLVLVVNADLPLMTRRRWQFRRRYRFRRRSGQTVMMECISPRPPLPI